ncbi:MAG: Crp/Fnr family transcriptional regulator [Clostridia bacterium]|nr:Crp/Fnr family transcriptional regulator [Clostridia bacterium]
MNLNFNVENFIHDFENSCHKAQKKFFAKNEVITTYIQKRDQFCILINGNADLVRYDLNGNRTIVEHFSKNDIFGEVFYTITTNNELLVEAREKCEVLIYTYNDIHMKCRNHCKFHPKLSEYLPELILGKVNALNMRVELLTKRSIRDKLLGYFSLLSTRHLSKTFSLPFSLTDLADYLSIDRSAMMREMKLLKEDGLIEKNGHKITLLYK